MPVCILEASRVLQVRLMWDHLISGEVYQQGLGLRLRVVLFEGTNERLGNVD